MRQILAENARAIVHCNNKLLQNILFILSKNSHVKGHQLINHPFRNIPVYTWLVFVLKSSLRLSSSYLMQTLRPQAPEVPHHVGVFHMGLGIALLGVDERWELQGVKGTGPCDMFYTWFVLTKMLWNLKMCSDHIHLTKGNCRFGLHMCLLCRPNTLPLNFEMNAKQILAHTSATPTHQKGIPDKENGSVVACQVPVSLLSVKLDSKASGVSHRVGWSWLPRWKVQKKGMTFYSCISEWIYQNCTDIDFSDINCN